MTPAAMWWWSSQDDTPSSSPVPSLPYLTPGGTPYWGIDGPPEVDDEEGWRGLTPQPVEDVIDFVGDRVDDVGDGVGQVYNDGRDLLEQGIEQIPDATARAAGVATATLVITGTLTALTVWAGFKLWK